MPASPNSTLPIEFVERLQEIVPAQDLDRVLRTFSTPRSVGFRVNSLLTESTAVLAELDRLGVTYESVDWCPEAFTAKAEFRPLLVNSKAFGEGRIYIQNLSSLVPVLLLDPQPGEAVLDLAAAPGGKTLHMAARMNNQGRLSAVEAIRPRYYRLCQNLRQGGATMVRTYLKDGRVVGNKTPEQFDCVLLDAPCSSEARFRCDKPESWQYWGPRKIREQARKQFGLLKSAVKALRPGGRLVYCTCSFAPEENEVVVDRLLRRDDSIEVMPIVLPMDTDQSGLTCWREKSLSNQLANARRILPTGEMDGFFVCLLRKSAENADDWRGKRRK